MAASDLGGDRLCVWTAAGGDAAGVDTGLRARRTAVAWGSSREALDGQRADAGPAVGAVAGPGSGPFTDAAWDLAAPADSDSRQRVGGRQGWLAGWRWTRWPCAEGVWREPLCGWWTQWITRRHGWSCGRCGDVARSGRWRRCAIW